MIEFIISKIGILLFALATASVLIFFSLGMKDMFIAEQGREIATSIIKQAKGLTETDSLCASLRLNLPRYIDIYGSTETFSMSAINYFFRIESIQLQNDKQTVVFGIYKKKGKNTLGQLFSVDSFNTKAGTEIVFITADPNETESNKLTWDPTSKTSNVVYVVKNMEQGIEKIYFVECGYDPSNANSYESCAILLANKIPGAYCVPKT